MNFKEAMPSPGQRIAPTIISSVLTVRHAGQVAARGAVRSNQPASSTTGQAGSLVTDKSISPKPGNTSHAAAHNTATNRTAQDP
jgi:hypothetical protein